jgi:alkanesulfonate monooxygenase SsuD/methylene tetrahydromethanopterin reductase-like flavin-dependent oxidoreductase (luciferase family)
MGASFGLIVPNRAVILGAVTAKDLVDLATQGEASGAFDTVWVGDSLLAKPRVESVTLLSALATVTTKVRLGVGCMATFAHRHPVLLAQQWAWSSSASCFRRRRCRITGDSISSTA